MKKIVTALIASVALSTVACQSIESTKVDPNTIASNGEAVAVVQATALGITAIFNFVTIVDASLDTVVNKMLVSEAKSLGGNKVQLLTAMETPKGTLIFRLAGGIISWIAGSPQMAMASGIIVK
jgi:hypothetical protein